MSSRLLFILIVFTTASAFAQLEGRVELGAGYDDNAFSNTSAMASSFSHSTLELDFFPEFLDAGIGYAGTFATYGAYPDRRFSLHTVHTSWLFGYGEDDANSVAVSALFGLRLDAPEFNYYDYTQPALQAGIKHYFTETLNSNAGYSIRYRTYGNFADMSYTEHTAWIGGNESFESGTSVTLRIDYGLKNYSPIDEVVTEPVTSTVAGNMLTIEGGGPGSSGGNGSGSGNGSGNGSGSGSGNGMQLRGAGQMHNNLGGSAQIVTYDDALTSQLRTSVVVGQSLGETTGLSLSYLKRINLNARSRAIVGGTVEFIGEEELFDDPYSYESDEASIKLTQLLPWEMTFLLSSSIQWKRYSYPSNTSDPSSAAKSDRRYGSSVGVTKVINGEWLLFSGFEINLAYTFIRNESNASWYDYHGNDISFSLGTAF